MTRQGNPKTRVLHLATSTDTGGAEIMLEKLVTKMGRERFETSVFCLLPVGEVGRRIREAGVPVESLGLSHGSINPAGLVRFVKMARDFRPDAVMTWMYHADLLGALARPFFKAPLFWNLRCSDLNLKDYGRLTRSTVRLCVVLSRVPRAVVANSRAGKSFHENMGYHPRDFRVIPNGFDSERFRPDPLSRQRMIESWGLSEEHKVLGLAARFDPAKGHRIFLEAAGRVHKNDPKARFVLCGEGVDSKNEELAAWIKDQGLSGAVLLLGRRDDMPAVFAGWDAACLASLSEGFPNVLGEAMASGLPCVATDAGDCRDVLGDAGRIVPPGDAPALAQAMEEILSMDSESRAELGKKARERIRKHYSLEAVVRQYEVLFADQDQDVYN